MKTRPEFEELRTYEEFSKYYWYREELVAICRRLGICASGYKAELNERIEEYFKKGINSGREKQNQKLPQTQIKKSLQTPAQKSVSQKVTAAFTQKNPDSELSLETGLIECNFRFSQRFRDFFSAQTGIKKFKFNADMVASARKVREMGDTAFTLGDLLDIYYGRKSYAQYDKVALQWNKFVKDFCADPATVQFSNKLKVAARLWKEVRESTREKIYKHELLEEFKEEL
ncbi:MAG: SAP domain-containing protein [Treponema sp.]|nr:SAP domain-containing protein [Treponema sp.]